MATLCCISAFLVKFEDTCFADSCDLDNCLRCLFIKMCSVDCQTTLLARSQREAITSGTDVDFLNYPCCYCSISEKK